MSKTVLAEISGWTPVIDHLVLKHGILTAAVFGKIWRYCQGSFGVCTASQQRIADELGISRATVNEHCQILVDAGYLEVSINGRTNTYRDTGRAGLKVIITAPVSEIDTSEIATCQSSLQQMSSKPTTDVSEIDTKKVLKRVEDTSTTTGGERKNVYRVYEENIGLLTPFIADELDDLEKTYTELWVIEAIKEAVKSNANNLKYARAILARWKVQGFKSQKPQPRGTSPSRGGRPAAEQQSNREMMAAAAERDAKNFVDTGANDDTIQF